MHIQGKVKPCLNAAELAKHGHMDIGVRFRGSPATRSTFMRAFKYYSTVLDMNWHIEKSTACVIDVSERKWTTAVVGQAHPDGRIEIDPRHLDSRERYLVAVHEIGHELGLEHSKNKQGYSVMVNWIDDFRGTNMLDAADMAALGVRHQLR